MTDQPTHQTTPSSGLAQLLKRRRSKLKTPSKDMHRVRDGIAGLERPLDLPLAS